MSNYKKFNYLLLSTIIFSLPFLEFINHNFNEKNIILQKSYYVLIFLVFIFILIISILINFFFKKINFYDSLIISVVGFWILFKHGLINNSLLKIEIINFLMSNFSSEISLIFILLIFLLFLILFIKDNYFVKKFIFIFFYLQFFLILFSLSKLNLIKSNSLAKDHQINEEILFSDLKNNKKPNIYYFILDAMQPIKEFENYYKIDLSSFLNELKKKDYVYLDNTLNFYDNTADSLSTFFNLDKILSGNSIKKKTLIRFSACFKGE